MKKILAFTLALVCVLALASCGGGSKPDTEKSEGVMYHADYIAAELESEVAIEAYIQAKAFSAEYGNINMFLQDADGGYYVYRMPCTADDDAKLKIGAKVKITGFKTEWAGEIEIAEGSAEYTLLDGEYIAEAEDITAMLGTDDLIKKMNMKVAFKGLTVAPSTAADGSEAAFLYNWDGSGAAGSNSDLYFNVDYNGNVYTFTVESDECAEGSEVYTAVTALKVGDKIDCEGFLYWYEGVNPHITAVTPAA